jgi:dolichyl-phosphate-mannose-protein mannosyltransferase
VAIPTTTPPPTTTSAPRVRRWLSPFCLVAAALIALGAFLRLRAFAFPRTFLFDEHHFVENARNYLAGRADWNDHPPLGKLFIAASILLFGDNPVGWRTPALLCGAVVVAGGGLAAARLFRSCSAGLIAAALLSADGFFISYSRAGLLDGYLAACAVLALVIASRPWTLLAVLGAGLLGGATPSIKFSGGAVLVPLLISLGLAPLTARRRLTLGALVLVLSAATYVVGFAIGLRLTDQPAGPADVVRATQKLLEHHAGLTDMKNPWTSSWPTWAVPTRPLMLGYVGQTGTVRALTSLGNLATWWAAMAVGLLLGWTVLRRGLSATLVATAPPSPPDAGSLHPDGFLRDHGRATLLALSTALAFLAPWVLTRRDSYVYHFLPSYAALVILLAGFLGWCRANRPLVVLGFLVVVLLVAAFYAPLWSFLPISVPALRHRLFLESWR